jgi:hypothetical protein
MKDERKNDQGEKHDNGSGMKQAHFKACPCCKSRELVKFDMDFFCMSCDWNSILFDVYSGNFEKRIGLNNRNRARAKATSHHQGVILLEDLATSMTTASPHTTAPLRRMAPKKLSESA